MHKLLRWRLTLWFLAFSGLVYFVLALAAGGLSYEFMTKGLDESMEVLISHVAPALDIEENGVTFKNSFGKLSTEWSRLRATVQLFDRNGLLKASYGPPGAETLVREFTEVNTPDGRRFRSISDPLNDHGQIVGYLQVQVPTELRDNAMHQFIQTMGWLAPVLLITLAASGYMFSGKAIRPVEEAFATLQRFMGDAGHELNTPISVIQLTAENLTIDREEDVELNKELHVILRSADRMKRLVSDMVLLSKLEVRQVPMKNEPVKVDELVSDVVDEFKLKFAQRNIKFQLEETAPAVVQGDRDSLYRVIVNLIENALRYTDNGKQVIVRQRKGPDGIKVSIEDTGVGIPKESLPHIFQRFYRVDKSRARAEGGSGLGLSIVQAICEHHGGKVQVQSEEGKGSTFTVFLPSQTAQMQAIQANSGKSGSATPGAGKPGPS